MDTFDNSGIMENNDWVEIYNKGSENIDISNVVIYKDAKDVCYTFPSDSIIEGGSYIVIDRASGKFAKGISNTKSVMIQLLTPDGTVIDTFDKNTNISAEATHEIGGSYARVPNGTGDWTVISIGMNTKGLDNDSEVENPYAGLVLNEICGYGTDESLKDKDDWIELYNNNEKSINLKGLKILYSNGTPEVVDEELYEFTSNTILNFGDFHVISFDYISGKNISNVKAIVVKLVSANGNIIDMFDRSKHSVGEGHTPRGSYARIPNGTGTWYAIEENFVTKGSENPESYVKPEIEPSDLSYYEPLVLNEVCGYGSASDDDWVEIYNNSENVLNISGVILKKDFTQIYKVPSGTIISPNQYLVFGIKNGDFSNGISNSKAVRISLHMPDGVEIENQVFNKVAEVDDVLYGNGHPNGGSYARIPNGTGDFTVVNIRTEGAINVN